MQFVLLVLALFLFLPGCASHKAVGIDVNGVEIEEEIANEADPFEGINRKTFVFNGYVDDYAVEPISDAYKWITPQFVQTGVHNFFSNLDDINVIINDALQGKFVQTAADGGRFFVNSTFGLLGLFDVATGLGLEKHEEDFAQTLAVWGTPAGPYLVIPVLGPMTTRGIPGGVFDMATNPASYVGLFSVQFMQMVNARATADDALRFIDEAALDPYIFTRESFLQYRQHLIKDGKSQSIDDFLDFEDDFYLEDEEMSDEFESNELPTSK
jgi:phospholipid-binding lipoprotein MlaA